MHELKNRQTLTVRVDPDRLQQILLNLLTNAIKFTPSGGHVSVAVSENKDQVLIEVHDTGRGIAKDQIGLIFEPFVQVNRLQTESSQRGIGLGLTICRELARAMNGDLTVRSILGEGSVFTLSLPQCETLS
ncbi:Histidine kinase-, DNA gyrase B-, and HSP90-like ATPase [Abditibacterium utsteinense]|uniref:histidine kinase n=1 Tax=Abditibacterium utsteinense TaxID=1960156 RepID=A0A2S8SQL1_9BACT|nr:ATP-binding protein [Abditibacterium utsteinense]PQV63078.1 Histidine kinase-, DNA gyrase B-, and HSP90-like ATPase [Abditibacterium utsteinense]